MAIVFLILFLVLGAVSALGDVDYFDRNATVQLGGFDFKIPAGYGPVLEGSIHTTDNGVKKDGEFFVNDENDVLAINVFSGNINPKLEEFVPYDVVKEKQTINGHDGILFHEFGYYHKYFIYEDSGSVVLVQANTVSEIEDIIPK